ncbi:hypothetical protein LCGC14_0116060 [marine sediment metagenome]
MILADKMFPRIAWPVIAVALVTALTGCFSSEAPVSEIYGSAMGSTYSVKWVSVDGAPDEQALQKSIDELLGQFDREVSTWRADSDLALFNAESGGICMTMPTSVLELATLANTLHRQSGGSFDVTVGPLLKLWGFHGGNGAQIIPSEEALAQVLSGVGQQRLRIEGNRLCKDANISVDVSAVAAGYMVDKLVEHLGSFGITSYMVEVTGELKAAGLKPGRRPWRIAIEEPRDHNRVAQLIIPLDGYGVSTSGDYRNYFEFEGKRYSHTFDPASGKPVMHQLAAVTVLRPSAAEADGLSTILLVKGPKDGWQFAMDNDIAALFVIRKNEGFVSRSTPQFKALQQGEE